MKNKIDVLITISSKRIHSLFANPEIWYLLKLIFFVFPLFPTYFLFLRIFMKVFFYMIFLVKISFNTYECIVNIVINNIVINESFHQVSQYVKIVISVFL